MEAEASKRAHRCCLSASRAQASLSSAAQGLAQRRCPLLGWGSLYQPHPGCSAVSALGGSLPEDKALLLTLSLYMPLHSKMVWRRASLSLYQEESMSHSHSPKTDQCGSCFHLFFFLMLLSKRIETGPEDSGEGHSFHQKTYCLKLEKVLENICILF